MAGRKLDQYKPVKFYRDNAKAKKSGFSKFEVDGEFYFCRNIDGEIGLISQAYSSVAGRDNGIESVKKNSKAKKNFKIEERDGGKWGCSLRAGNGQEVAVSPNLAKQSDAENLVGRLTGSRKGASAKKAVVKTAAPKAKATKAAPKAAVVAAAGQSFTSKDGRVGNYKPLSFYETHSKDTQDGFTEFSDSGAHYFAYRQGDEVVLISESYTTEAARDNGVASVKKNMPMEKRYAHRVHKNGKHYFDLKAGNHQEIATSRWYNTKKAGLDGAKRLRGEMPVKKGAAAAAGLAAGAGVAARATNVEQDYKPLNFYQKQTKGRKNGIESFKGEDGKFYFAHFEDSKIALISEGYPTAAARDVGVASVKKNIKLENRYDYRGPLANGKYDYRLKAGNNKEIARSIWYGSAAAAAAGAAYLIGTRRRVPPVAPKPVAPAPVAAAPIVAKPIAPKPIAPKPMAAAPIAAAAVAGTAAAASAIPRREPAAAAPPPAPVQEVAPAGIWGWLKWLLLGFLALLALFFIFKTCAKPDIAVAPPPVPKVVMASCWDGSEAASEAACPTKITCWDGSFVKSRAACPVEPAPEPVMMTCWNGDRVEDLTSCPKEPAPRAAVVATSRPDVTAVAANGIFATCGPNSRSIKKLGTNPEFGDSRSLDSAGFYAKLQNRHAVNRQDKAYLEFLSRQLGYSSWSAVPASAITETSVAQGQNGVLGFGSYHGYQCASLDVTDATDLDAFRIASLNGREVYFMKRCGNFFYPTR